ncbi:uroporphyrinogen-III C-methyltransferase [Paraburkholderia sp. MMS20-SJTN17]|uniref:uroporphyrinogen-III C-methyltransferase n=2 Tax=Paraburkholderia translucens TaxID=2886945 RepID=A0ABS8KIA9_9BURK|nr:uroporphyrinogen-III C-methyltransferase [Paraburkholderia sp. MMS20-SJTN17]
MHAAMTRAWLIGAGPGDVELMTLKATRALARADVVLVDDLVNPEVLQFARADAQVVYVGKRGGHPSTPQADIVAQMLEHLRAGRSVARLKGGDPFVFGRGGEELQALQAAGIEADVINGITAGIAAPAALGIAVTHRDYAQGVVFVTGHGAGSGEPDWAALAATRMTLVIYMGMRRLADIAGALLAAGMSADMPCAAIESATRPEQRHVLAPLRDFADAVARARLGSPAIVVIGGVASLALAREAAKRDAGSMKTLSVGIGCRLHSEAADIDAAVRAALGSHDFEQIGTVATIDTKVNETGLLEFCSRHQLPLRLFSREQIAAVPVASPSVAAHAHLGVDGVCEPCALLAAAASDAAASTHDARLVVRKTAHAGVTVAIAAANHAAPAPHPAHQDQDLR